MPKQNTTFFTNIQGLGGSFTTFLKDIKVSHSLFALPFAASSFVIGKIPIPGPTTILLLIICIVSARSFAMGVNRLFDAHFDKLNPRTENRALPSGKLSTNQSIFWLLFFVSIFVAASFQLSSLAGYLSIPVLLVLGFYSFLKRIFVGTHFYLGFCLGLSPIAVAIALDHPVPLPLFLLATAVMLWTSGFDLLYSLQDQAIDRQLKLKSMPIVLGVRKTLFLSRLLFVLVVCLMIFTGISAHRGVVYYLGVAGIAILLFWEHYLIKDSTESHLSKNLNLAFFNVNAWVSLIYFFTTVLDESTLKLFTLTSQP